MVVLSVAAKLSGTFRTYQLAAKSLQESGEKITIIDTRLNASAQGLVVQQAARQAAEGLEGELLLNSIRDTANRTTIMVSVQSLQMMVRGGRIPKRLGSMILKMNFKPMIGLTKEGGGKILGVRFSRAGSITALVKHFMRVHKKEGIQSYGMSYIGSSELAFSVAEIVERKTGLKPLFVEQASPVIALHAGKGSISLSFVRKGSSSDTP